MASTTYTQASGMDGTVSTDNVEELAQQAAASAAAAAADLVKTDLDTIATAADVLQTGADRSAVSSAIADAVGVTVQAYTAVLDGITASYTTAEETKLAGVETAADVTDATNVTAAGALMDGELTAIASVKALNQGLATTDSPTFDGLDVTGDVSFGDNDKALFGAGSDLQIYHDGANSYIADSGTGRLELRGSAEVRLASAGGEAMIRAYENAGVELYHDNSEKLATTATGIDVTGTITSDGLTVDGGATSPTISITGARSGTLATISNTSASTSNGLIVSTASTNANSNPLWVQSNGADRLKIAGSGDISFYEDTGTTPKFFWDASAESLGIGTISPDAQLTVLGEAQTYNFIAGTDPLTNFAIINENSAAGTGAAIVLGSTYSGAADVANARIFAERQSTGSTNAGAANLVFEVGQASGSALVEALRIDSSGHAIIPAGVTLGTAAGTYVADNTLDDYEEGTWTPVITDGTNNATSNIAVGSYTKVGTHVHVQGRIRLSSFGSVTGALEMSGLPFASQAVSNNFSAMTIGRAVGLNLTAGTVVVGDLRSNVTKVQLNVWDASLGNTNLQDTEFTADGDISFSMDYISN